MSLVAVAYDVIVGPDDDAAITVWVLSVICHGGAMAVSKEVTMIVGWR